jgi:hypothetical protein
MAVTLLILGVTLFLVGSLGLFVKFRERGKPSLSVCLPLASVGPARECWSDTRFFVLARLLGLALVGAGAGVAIARDPLVLEDPQRVWGVQSKPYIAGSERVQMNRYVNASDAIMMAIRHDTAKELSGRIHGESFDYDRVELIDGVLTARQGSGFLPELEVRVFLDASIDGANLDEPRTISVRPGNPTAPVVHISWRDARGRLQTEIIRRGYHMELQLAQLDQQQLKGFMQLILPDGTRSFLSGEFVAYTNRLRYKDNGQVDRGYTHPDTLEYVARVYVLGQYPSGAVTSVRFDRTRILGSRAEGSTVARVRLDDGSVERKEIALQFSRGEWVVRRESVTTKVVQGDDSGQDGSEENQRDARPEGEPVDRSTPEQPRRIKFAELAEYQGQTLRTERHDSKLQKGTLKKVGDERIELATNLSGGTVRYHVKKDELKRVRLSDGRVLLVGAAPGERNAGNQRDQTSSSPDTAPAAPENAAPGTSTGRDGSNPMKDVRAMQGRRVRITGEDGEARVGKLSSVEDGTLTLTVSMGGGSVDYYYEASEIDDLEAVSAP